jgi:hypothetical protein
MKTPILVQGTYGSPSCGRPYSYFNKNCDPLYIEYEGRLIKSYEWRTWQAKKNGAGASREITFLNHNDDKEETMEVLYPDTFPFKFNYIKKQFDLSRVNHKFIDGIGDQCDINNAYDMIYIYSAADRCHEIFINSPLMNNIQGLYGLTKESWKYYKVFFLSILKKLKGKNFMIELKNEPTDEDFPFVSAEMIHILKAEGVPLRNIIIGSEHLSKNIRKDPYNYDLENHYWLSIKRHWKNEGLYPRKQSDVITMGDPKYNMSRTIHNFNEKVFEYFKHIPGTKARYFISDDGLPKMSKEQLFHAYNTFFSETPVHKNEAFKNEWLLEHICRTEKDHFDGILGLSMLVLDLTGIRLHNENYEFKFFTEKKSNGESPEEVEMAKIKELESEIKDLKSQIKEFESRKSWKFKKTLFKYDFDGAWKRAKELFYMLIGATSIFFLLLIWLF